MIRSSLTYCEEPTMILSLDPNQESSSSSSKLSMEGDDHADCKQQHNQEERVIRSNAAARRDVFYNDLPASHFDIGLYVMSNEALSKAAQQRYQHDGETGACATADGAGPAAITSSATTAGSNNKNQGELNANSQNTRVRASSPKSRRLQRRSQSIQHHHHSRAKSSIPSTTTNGFRPNPRLQPHEDTSNSCCSADDKIEFTNDFPVFESVAADTTATAPIMAQKPKRPSRSISMQHHYQHPQPFHQPPNGFPSTTPEDNFRKVFPFAATQRKGVVSTVLDAEELISKKTRKKGRSKSIPNIAPLSVVGANSTLGHVEELLHSRKSRSNSEDSNSLDGMAKKKHVKHRRSKSIEHPKKQRSNATDNARFSAAQFGRTTSCPYDDFDDFVATTTNQKTPKNANTPSTNDSASTDTFVKLTTGKSRTLRPFKRDRQRSRSPSPPALRRPSRIDDGDILQAIALLVNDDDDDEETAMTAPLPPLEPLTRRTESIEVRRRNRVGNSNNKSLSPSAACRIVPLRRRAKSIEAKSRPVAPEPSSFFDKRRQRSDGSANSLPASTAPAKKPATLRRRSQSIEVVEHSTEKNRNFRARTSAAAHSSKSPLRRRSKSIDMAVNTTGNFFPPKSSSNSPQSENLTNSSREFLLSESQDDIMPLPAATTGFLSSNNKAPRRRGGIGKAFSFRRTSKKQQFQTLQDNGSNRSITDDDKKTNNDDATTESKGSSSGNSSGSGNHRSMPKQLSLRNLGDWRQSNMFFERSTGASSAPTTPSGAPSSLAASMQESSLDASLSKSLGHVITAEVVLATPQVVLPMMTCLQLTFGGDAVMTELTQPDFSY